VVSTISETLRSVPTERLVDLDVREELRAGGEPFARIMTAVRALPKDGVLRLRATFEPAPLYRVLGKQGFSHATEQLATEDWRVWFYRDAAPVPVEPVAPAADAGTDDVIVLDVRDLNPPEPMMRTLAALEKLPRGKILLQINARVPQFLLPKLAQRGFVYEIREQPEVVRVFIRHSEQ
jgi:TusA-related sulfurtransferase